MSELQELDRLASLVAARAKRKLGDRPALRVVAAPKAPAMDALTRESHIKMIGHIRRRWGYPMQQLIDQACFGLSGPDQLPDDELVALHRDLERAQDCMRDGVSFEDAGLLRARCG